MTIAQYQAQYERQHRMWEKRMAPIFLNALKKQMEPVLLSTDFNEDLVRPEAIAMAFNECYTKVGLYFASNEYKRLKTEETKADLSIEFMSQRWLMILREIALTNAFDTIMDITDYTKERLRFALAEAAEKGLGAEATARLIREYTLNEFGRLRAMVIARTETTYASNEGKRISAEDWAKQIGTILYKKWLVRVDGREREWHRVAGTDKAVKSEAKFIVGGEKMNAPGDISASASNRVNCRCTTIYLSERKARQYFSV